MEGKRVSSYTFTVSSPPPYEKKKDPLKLKFTPLFLDAVCRCGLHRDYKEREGAVLFNLGFAGEKFSLKYIYFRVRQANTWRDKRHFVQDKKHD